MSEKKFYICETCGNLVEVVHASGVPMVCCGKKMKEIVPEAVPAEEPVKEEAPAEEVKEEAPVIAAVVEEPAVEAAPAEEPAPEAPAAEEVTEAPAAEETADEPKKKSGFFGRLFGKK